MFAMVSFLSFCATSYHLECVAAFKNCDIDSDIDSDRDSDSRKPILNNEKQKHLQ